MVLCKPISHFAHKAGNGERVWVLHFFQERHLTGLVEFVFRKAAHDAILCVCAYPTVRLLL